MRKGIFERAYLNWHYRKDILMKDISERAFPKGHFDEGHFEGRAFPKGERAKGMKGIVHKLEFPPAKSPFSHSFLVKTSMLFSGQSPCQWGPDEHNW